MILEKTARTNEPFEADMSGLRITPFANTWIIKEVEPATSGAAATSNSIIGSVGTARPASYASTATERPRAWRYA